MAHSNGTEKRACRVLPPLPVDRGWSWLIMLAAYVNLMVATIFARALAILLPFILDRYEASATVTTLAVGICDLAWAASNVAIPTLLLPRFSVRSLALVGSVFHSFCIVGIAYSPNVIVFNIIFGVMGASLGLMLIPTLIHLGHFFQKRLSFANGFTHAGISTATVFAPRLTQYLESIYGYQGALLIIAGICFNCVAASMLLRPLSMYSPGDTTKDVSGDALLAHSYSDFGSIQLLRKASTYDNDDETAISERSTFLDDDDSTNKQFRNTNLSPELKMKENTQVTNGNIHQESKEGFDETEKLIAKLESKLTHPDLNEIVDDELKETFSWLKNTISDTTASQQTAVSLVNNRNSTCSITANGTSSPDVILTYTDTQNGHVYPPTTNDVQVNNNLHLNGLKPASDTDAELPSNGKLTSSQTKHDCSQTNPIVDKEPGFTDNDGSVPPCRCWSIGKLRTYLRSSVLLNPVAVMLILAGGLSTPGGNMYIPVLGLENGVSPEEVPWIQTIMGVADIVGKLSIGYFADLGYLRPIRIACLAQITVGLTCQFTMFYKGFGAMAAMVTVYGMTAGICPALIVPLIIEMVGLQHLSQVTPVYFLVNGLATFVSNVEFGAFRDATGSFIGGFNFLGGMFLLSLTIFLLEPAFVRCRDKRNSKESLRASRNMA